MPMPAVVVFVVVVLVVLFLMKAAMIAREYERVVVFRLGRLQGIRGPGLFLLIPFVDTGMRVDLRTITLSVPPQEIITKDNVTVTVNAVAYFRVTDPQRAVVQVEQYLVATSQVAQTALRSVLGQVDLDQLLQERESINVRLQGIIEEQTKPWGVTMGLVEVKDVELPQSMQRAIARQAEAERERRAKVIASRGELEASKELAQAARVIAAEPAALQLRYLQTIAEVGTSENARTLVVPFPVEMLDFFKRPAGIDLLRGLDPDDT